MIIRPGDCLGAWSAVLRQIQIQWFSPGDRTLDPGVPFRFGGIAGKVTMRRSGSSTA